MSARETSGPLPWSGSRARTRDLGYATAMKDLWRLARDLERGPMPAEQALAALGSYAFDAWHMAVYPSVSPHMMAGFLGGWMDKPAPAEGGQEQGGGR